MSRHYRRGGRSSNKEEEEEDVFYREDTIATAANLHRPGAVKYERYFIAGAILAMWFAVVLTNLQPSNAADIAALNSGGGTAIFTQRNVIKTVLIMTSIAARPVLMVIDWPLQVIATTARVVHELACAAGLHDVCHNPCRDHDIDHGFIDVFAHLVYVMEVGVGGGEANDWWSRYLQINGYPSFHPLYELPIVRLRLQGLYRWLEDHSNGTVERDIDSGGGGGWGYRLDNVTAKRLAQCHDSELLFNLACAIVPLLAMVAGLF